MMIAPIDRRPLPVFPGNPTDTVDRATHGMLDGDGNGKVSRDEWIRAGWDADRFALFDADGDGQVTEQEFVASKKLEREFNQKDADGNGRLGRWEFDQMKYMLGNHFGVVGGGMLKATEKAESLGKEAAGHVLRCMPPMIRDRFAKFDTDRDGTISKEEYFAGRRAEQKQSIPIRPWPPLHEIKPVLLAKDA